MIYNNINNNFQKVAKPVISIFFPLVYVFNSDLNNSDNYDTWSYFHFVLL